MWNFLKRLFCRQSHPLRETKWYFDKGVRPDVQKMLDMPEPCLVDEINRRVAERRKQHD